MGYAIEIKSKVAIYVVMVLISLIELFSNNVSRASGEANIISIHWNIIDVEHFIISLNERFT
jgi:hypothetical protein